MNKISFKQKNIFKVLLLISLNTFAQAYEDGEIVMVGQTNPIGLEFRDPKRSDSISDTRFSNLIGTGNVCIGVYSKNMNQAVKIIKTKDLVDGNEIKISKIAGDLGVGPKFYGAWVTNFEEHGLCIIIDMQWLNTHQKTPFRGFDIIDKYSKLVELLDENKKDKNTYFFDRLLTMLKLLVQKKISYYDLHVGNIMHPGKNKYNDLQLIDFDSAKLHETEKEAALRTLNAPYVFIWTDMFENLRDNQKGQIAKEALEYLKKTASL